jgi:ATP-dependent DNA ligase
MTATVRLFGGYAYSFRCRNPGPGRRIGREMSDLPFTALAPMEARSQPALPEGEGWRFEPKWDGFRCLAFKQGTQVWLQAKSGKPLTRYFPEVAAALAGAAADAFVLDGELVVDVGQGPSFEALQLRLHPAQSRIERLSRETPARLLVFDCVAAQGQSLVEASWRRRQAALDALWPGLPASPRLARSPGTDERRTAQAWLAKALPGRDGVVAKRVDGPYTPDERSMVKVKRKRTADCVVGGFRSWRDTDLVGSLLLGLYDDQGRLDHVGFTATLTNAERPELTRRLRALASPPGFTGDAPGGPSRWSSEKSAQWTPLRPELVVEVAFDHVSGGRFRHGVRLLRWRPDKRPDQCRMEQLEA